MNSIQSSLYAVAIALCLFSTGILSGKKSRTGKPLAYFTSFLIIETLAFVFELLMAHPVVPLKALWLGLRMGSGLLVAPCLWLAIKENAEGARPSLSSLGRVQLILIAAGGALTLPLIATAHLGVDYPDPHHVVSPLLSRVIHGTMLLCIAIFAWQIPFYLWRCRRLLMRQLSASNGAIHSPAWLHLPLVILLATWLLGLLRTVQCASHAPPEFSVLFAVADVSITVGAIYTMVRRAASPQFVQTDAVRDATVGSPLASVTNLAPESETARIEPPAVNSSVSEAVPVSPPCRALKYSKSTLPPFVRERIKCKLETALVRDSIYQNSLLNLRSLSGSIKENAHYVSQVISQDLHSNFYQLVNHHRIEQAKNLLTEYPDQTILAVALAVGFNSKSTFNNAFRRNTGTTPKEYRSSHPKRRAAKNRRP
jgi:AraC-like DNA-binding protein